ncbi:hypothetical protein PAMP_004873 [Pampus punctatissimus]
MASNRGVPGAGVFGDLPPSYTRSQPPANPDLLRRPSYCHAAFALKQISKAAQSALARGLFGNVVGPVKEFTD